MLCPDDHPHAPQPSSFGFCKFLMQHPELEGEERHSLIRATDKKKLQEAFHMLDVVINGKVQAEVQSPGQIQEH